MTFMMMSSDDAKSDICQFFYQDLFDTEIYKILFKMDKNFLRYISFHCRPTMTPPPPPPPDSF